MSCLHRRFEVMHGLRSVSTKNREILDRAPSATLPHKLAKILEDVNQSGGACAYQPRLPSQSPRSDSGASNGGQADNDNSCRCKFRYMSTRPYRNLLPQPSNGEVLATSIEAVVCALPSPRISLNGPLLIIAVELWTTTNQLRLQCLFTTARCKSLAQTTQWPGRCFQILFSWEPPLSY